MLFFFVEKFIVKKCLILLMLAFTMPVYAQEQVQTTGDNIITTLVTPQYINYQNCTKIFSADSQKLFLLTLVSIASNRFNIDEIQTSDGYIIFSVNRNKYLATIAGIDNKNSILKITPCNNVYKFPPGIISNTFKYIDLNLTTKI